MSPWRILETYFLHLAAASRAVDFGTRRPGRPYLLSVEFIDMLVYRQHLALSPVLPEDEVADRVLNVSLDGLETQIHNAPDVTKVFVDGRLGQHLIVTLRDFDAPGNPSEPSDPLDLVVSDTVPPHQPGVVRVESVEAVEVPDPTPPDAGPTP